nr:hypothetical protein [Alicyclobacillus sp. ALC3]
MNLVDFTNRFSSESAAGTPDCTSVVVGVLLPQVWQS